MEDKYYWLIFGVVTIFLLGISIVSHDYFYEMKKTNCKSIMDGIDAGTDAVADCKKFNNYPFMEFEITYWVVFGMLNLFGGLIIFGIHYWIEE